MNKTKKISIFFTVCIIFLLKNGQVYANYEEQGLVYSLPKEKVNQWAIVILIVFVIIIICLIINILNKKKIEIEMEQNKRILQKNIIRTNKLLKLYEAVLEVNHSIMEVGNINELYDRILEIAIKSIDAAELGSVFILNEHEILECVAFKNYNEKKMKGFCIPLKESFYWIKTKGGLGRPIIIDDLKSISNCKETVENTKESKTQSLIIAPIIIEGKFYGEISIDSIKKNAFTEEEIQIMGYFSNQIAIAISKHKFYEEKIYSAKFDKLTNIYNRRYFEEISGKILREALRYNGKFSLVIFDLNELKKVNDTYGHQIGDEYINSFVKRVDSVIRSSDIFARYGGDEFVGVFFESDYESLVKKFQGVNSKLKDNPIVCKDNEVICSFSFGIAQFPYDGKSYGELIKIADERMYKYKQEYKKNNC